MVRQLHPQSILLEAPLLAFHYPSQIGMGNVTINDVIISSATGDGLTVTMSPASTGDIVLNNVKSNNNTGRGAYLDNCAFSGTCQASGKITVNSGEFSNNQGGQGLYALSAGDITVNNVTADNNYFSGANLQNYLTSATSAISI